MSEHENTFEFLHLPLKSIQAGESISVPEFIISEAAESVIQTGRDNLQPLIVKKIKEAEYCYQVVCNPFVYEVAQKASLERVWCVVIDSHSQQIEQQIEQAKILTREITPKININKASYDTVLAALKYLVDDLKLLPKTVEIDKIAGADRESWSNFDEITKLKCKVTKAKFNLSVWESIFFLDPPLKVEVPPAPAMISLKKASREEIYERINYLALYKINGFDKLDVEQVSDTIFTALKTKWKSLNPLTKLDCSIDTKKLKILKELFSL
jgi:hypothetical protein